MKKLNNNKNVIAKKKEFIKAITNMIYITGDIDKTIKSLLMNTDNNIALACKHIDKIPNEPSEKYFKRLHQAIKIDIRQDLELSENTNVKYDYFWHDGKVYFLYIANKAIDFEDLFDQITIAEIQKHKILQSVLSLHLKSLYIDEFEDYEECKLQPVYFNSELYLDAKINEKGTIVNSLYPQIYVSKEHEIAINLHKKVFLVNKQDDSTRSDALWLIFYNKINSYKAKKELNAIRFSNKKYMDFYNYSECINYHQNDLVDKLINILKKYDVEYKKRYFQATDTFKDFLSIQQKNVRKKLIIINNLEDIDKKICTKFFNNLKAEFNILDIKNPKDYPSIDAFSENYIYLVLTTSCQDNSSSVIVNGAEENTFWDALVAYLKNSKACLDYYSTLKVARFISNKWSIVIQNCNLNADDLDDYLNYLSKLSEHEVKLKKYQATVIKYKKHGYDTKTLENPKKPKSPKLHHMLEKIKNELYLKEKIFIDKKITEINLKNSKLTVIYIRNLSKNKYKKEYFFASVVNIEIDNSILEIKSHKIVDDENKLLIENSFLKQRDKLYDDSCYIFDNINKVLLFTYNTARIPNIIGNSNFNNIKSAQKQDNKLHRRTRNSKEIVLPYYVSKKNESYAYLQAENYDLFYFVTQRIQINKTIEKQNLVYNLLTFDEAGEILKPLDQDVTKLYLRSLTDDILKINEYSKSSLIEKIAKLYIKN